MGGIDARLTQHVTIVLLAVAMAVLLVGQASRGRAQESGTLGYGVLAQPNAAEVREAEAQVDGELIVVFKEDLLKKGLIDRAVKKADLAGKVVGGEDSHIKTVLFEDLKGKKEKLKEKAKELSKIKGIEYAEPNGVLYLDYAPNDGLYPKQGNLKLVNMDSAWNLQKGGGARIAFIDSGISKGHKDTASSKVVAERDMVDRDATAQDVNGHGTHVVSIAAAKTDNRYGMAGAGFNARIVVCRAGKPNGTLEYAIIARCIDWIQRVGGVSVINMSFGGIGDYSQAVADEIAQSQRVYGMAVIASVGNTGDYVRHYFPADQPGVIGVGSNDHANKRSWFSSRGPHVDVMAPGHYVMAARRKADGGGFVYVTGTSFSAPTVAGCAALMYERGFDLRQVRGRLFRYAMDMNVAGRDDATGYGYLNCRRSLKPD